ncbi:MAG: hypothetical protein ACYCV6_01800 [Steroidobacteraceae bacterium]|jgi:hypothetical protein|nr:hypothetical protein [Pseudomonadota bacterium]
MNKPIPNAVLAPLTKTPWAYDEWSLSKFATLLEHHADADRREGGTCSYILSDVTDEAGEKLRRSELAAMVREGAIPTEMHDGDAVNQHWLHSLEQFYAEVTVAWQEHCRRTDALIGTPAGRIARRQGAL